MIKVLLRLRPYIMLAAILICALTIPQFRTVNNFLNLTRQLPVDGIVAIGMTVVIITGGFDLSVGSVMAISGIVTMLAMPFGIVPAVSAGIAAGLVVGLFNGLIIAYLGVNPFIATLGSMLIVRGLALGITDARPVPCSSIDFMMIDMSLIPALTMVALIVVIELFLKLTRGGHNIYIFGSNKEAGFAAGINMKRIQLSAYMISSFCAATAGIFLSARLATGSPIIADTAALVGIATVILGGTSLTGGSGSAVKTLTGILILGLLSNTLNMLGVSNFIQKLINGLLIVCVVATDAPILTTFIKGGVIIRNKTRHQENPKNPKHII